MATLKKRENCFHDQLSLNAGQKYCRMLQGEHSAIPLTFIKLLCVIKIFGLSFLEWLLKTGFTVTLRTPMTAAADSKFSDIFREFQA